MATARDRVATFFWWVFVLAASLVSGDAVGSSLEERLDAFREQAPLSSDPLIAIFPEVEAAGDTATIIEIVSAITQFLNAEGAYREGVPWSERFVAEVAAHEPESETHVEAQVVLALNLLGVGRSEDARRAGEEALRLALAVHGHRHLQTAWAQTVLAQILVGVDGHRALELAEGAVEMNDALGAPPDESLIPLQVMARAYTANGDVDAAITILDRAIEIGEALELGTGPQHLARGHLEYQAGRVDNARIDYETAIVSLDEFGTNLGVLSEALGSLGTVLGHLGDVEARRRVLARNLAVREEAYGADSPMFAFALQKLAGASPGDERGPLYRRAIDVLARSRGDEAGATESARAKLAEYLARRGDADEAAELCVRLESKISALDMGNRGIIASRCSIVRALGGEPEASVALGLAALSAFDEALGPDSPSSAASLIQILRNHQVLPPDEAQEFAERLLDNKSALVGRLYRTSTDREWLRTLGSTGHALGHYAAVFAHDPARVWERGLAWKGAIRQLARRHAGSDSARLDALRMELAAATDRDDEEAIATITLEKEELERRDAEAFGHVVLQGASPAQICAALPGNSALVDIYENPTWHRSYYAMVIRAGECQTRLVDLGAADDIDEAVRAWLDRASTPADLPTRVGAAGRRLRAKIWDPLVDAVGEAERIYVIPEGVLNRVPFGALPTRPGRFLIEERRFSYPEFAADVATQAGPTGSGALIVGGVDYGPQRPDEEGCLPSSFLPLSGTVLEARTVKSHLQRTVGRREIHSLSGTEPTPAAVTAAVTGKRFVHIASHGFFAAAEGCEVPWGDQTFLNPMTLSGIALAGANGGEGRWLAEEVATLNLEGVELVVLSACETGLGVATTGNGVLGLRHALSAAGAQGIVMSLWSVPDEETATLMDGFYRHLRKVPAGEALHLAKLDLIAFLREDAEFAHPALWAPFVTGGLGPQ